MERKIKSYEELNFTSDFIFCKILTQNKQLCKELIEIVLNRPIRDIKYINSQESMKFTYDSKGVRLDVYVEDYENTVYDVEMQIDINRNLPKRSRYYQGMIDLNMIKQGESYKILKESYVIFFCLKDPFGKGLAVYTFENRCSEIPELPLKDGTKKMFINSSGDLSEVTPELAAFLRYLKSGEATDEFTSTIDLEVENSIRHEKWRDEYMTFEQRILEEREDAWEEGRESGLAIGLITQIQKKYNKNKSLNEIADELEELPENIRVYYDAVVNNNHKMPQEIFELITEL